jgi:hypothetical protein
MLKKRFYYINCFQIFILAVIVSCKSSSVLLPNKIPVKKIDNKVLLKKFDENKIEIKNFRSKVNVNYNDQKRKQQINIDLRIEKNKYIWMSANMLVPIAKLLITSDSISFYEKFQKNYINENFKSLNNLIGSNLKLLDLQNLLLGNPIHNLKVNKFERLKNNKYYVLSPVSKINRVKPIYFFDPNNFLLKEQRFILSENNLTLNIVYKKHQIIEGKKCPKEIEISLYDGKNYFQISLDFLRVNFPLKLMSPFKIPDGYKKMNLK